MKNSHRTLYLAASCVLLLVVNGVPGQDWPQWRGPNRDGKATGFTAPKTWPKELTEKWKVSVGEGVATPALVGNKLIVFSRQSGKEIVRCLEADTGKELWKDEYDTQAATRPADKFSGPRCSPAAADGKVVTLGLRGVLSCYEIDSGKRLWRNDDKSFPRFFTSSSPLIVDGLCVVQLGGQRDGAIVAYELATGKEKWKWTGDGTEYASPSLLTVGTTKAVVAETSGKIVALNLADGKLLWDTPFAITGMRNYNASTPMVDGETVIFSGGARGTRAVKMEKKDKDLTGKELWRNDNAVQYNTPVAKDGMVFGLSSSDRLFCIDKDGKTAWTAPSGGRGGGYGTIVDAGPVLLSLPPSGDLIVFEPNAKEFKEVTKYKVGSGDTYAYPILSGKRLFVKDRDSVILLTIE